jgi:hypothetical protein
MENNNATLVEAKKAYTNQLISLITPQIYEGIKDLYECAKKNMKGKNVRHSFQIELQGVSVWNQLIIDNETERIIKNTNCGYLDKLVTVIFINSTKILASAYIGAQNTNTLEISVPKLSHFIHIVYIETAKEFYKNPFLLDENLRPRERQENLRSSIEAIKFGIEQAILRLLPIGEILSRDVANNVPQLEGPVEELQQNDSEEEEFDEDEETNETDEEHFEGGGETENVEDTEESVEELETVIPQDNIEELETAVPEDNIEELEETKEELETAVPQDNVEELEETKEESVNVIPQDNVEEPIKLDNNIETDNFVTEQVSISGIDKDGLSVEDINEANKEFIEEKKEDPTLVDDIVDEINLKSIELDEVKKNETTQEPIMVSKIEETANFEENNEVQETNEESNNVIVEDIQEEEEVNEIENDIKQDLEHINETENVELENVELENVEQNIETGNVGGDFANKTNEIIRSMKRDLHMNKKRFINPYRAKHNLNEKRLDRLQNIRVKRSSGMGLTQYY